MPAKFVYQSVSKFCNMQVTSMIVGGFLQHENLDLLTFFAEEEFEDFSGEYEGGVKNPDRAVGVRGRNMPTVVAEEGWSVLGLTNQHHRLSFWPSGILADSNSDTDTGDEHEVPTKAPSTGPAPRNTVREAKYIDDSMVELEKAVQDVGAEVAIEHAHALLDLCKLTGAIEMYKIDPEDKTQIKLHKKVVSTCSPDPVHPN